MCYLLIIFIGDEVYIVLSDRGRKEYGIPKIQTYEFHVSLAFTFLNWFVGNFQVCQLSHQSLRDDVAARFKNLLCHLRTMVLGRIKNFTKYILSKRGLDRTFAIICPSKPFEHKNV